MPKKKPFEELLQECMPNWKEDNGPLRNLARQYLGGHAKHLTDDAVSNTLIEALEVFSEFDQQKPFLPWFTRILKNNCIDAGRKQNRLLENHIEQAEGEEDDGDSGMVIDENTTIEWLPDEEGILTAQRAEDFYKTIELAEKEKDDLSILDDFFARPKPGQSFYDWYEEDGSWHALLSWGHTWEHLRFGWDEPQEPPEISTLRKMLKGSSREVIAKQEGKSRGAVDTEFHRVRKKIKSLLRR